MCHILVNACLVIKVFSFSSTSAGRLSALAGDFVLIAFAHSVTTVSETGRGERDKSYLD